MKKLIILTTTVLSTILFVGCTSEPSTTSEHQKEAVKQEEIKEPELPTIDQTIIEAVITQIKQDEFVKDAFISVKDNNVIMSIQVSTPVNIDTAKQLGENFARMLSGISGIGTPPSKESLGGLWDQYTLHVGVGTGPDNFIAKGVKVVTNKKITW